MLGYVTATVTLVPAPRLLLPHHTARCDRAVFVAVNDGNDVYELLPAVADGYFRVRPLKSASLYVNVDNTGAMKLSSDGIASQWTFGLREEMVNPYFDRAGYVGALTKEVAGLW